jgi:Eukaryotic-type carbonic anhydrase
MEYYDSGCTFDDIKKKNGFSIERHALKITQPMSSNEDGGKIRRLDCSTNRYGKIDFPKGYSDWWYLSHMDFHVPSEHTQMGKRYSGELQMYHFYSVTGKAAGVDNEVCLILIIVYRNIVFLYNLQLFNCLILLTRGYSKLGTVSVFLDVRPKQADWPILNRIICAWREAEEKNRAVCGLPSVQDKYDGCTKYSRGRRLKNNGNETLMMQATAQEYTPAKSAFDIILENDLLQLMSMNRNASFDPTVIHIDHDDNNVDEFDWDSFIAEKQNEGTGYDSKTNTRRLLNYDDVKWFNYFPLTDVKTEYYFRYSGSQTVPPCYGKYFPGTRNRHQTNAWRVMKDPMLISQRQLDEMHRLLRMRIAPKGSPVNSCKPDTAAKIEGRTVNVARPLQETRDTHYMVFCECEDWKSKFKADQDWCKRVRNQKDRLYKDPYNFDNNGY